MPRKKNPDDLTAAEEAFLRSDQANPVVRSLGLSKDMAVRASAYRKVARAARAERDALAEIRLLQVVREATASTPADPHMEALKAENDALRRQLANLTALSARAVHSDD